MEHIESIFDSELCLREYEQKLESLLTSEQFAAWKHGSEQGYGSYGLNEDLEEQSYAYDPNPYQKGDQLFDLWENGFSWGEREAHMDI